MEIIGIYLLCWCKWWKIIIETKQFKYTKLNNGNYALFNNLLLDLVFVEEEVFLKLQE